MKFIKSPIALCSSVVLHLSLGWGLSGIETTTQSDTRWHGQTVAVRLYRSKEREQSQSSSEPLALLPSRAPYSGSLKGQVGSKSAQQAVVDTPRVSFETEVQPDADVQKNAPQLPVSSLNQTSPKPIDSISSVVARDENLETGSRTSATSDSPLHAGFSTCRVLVLPQNWLSKQSFFPRAYSVEFRVIAQSGEPVFSVEKWTPEASAYPYADQLIKKSFEDCMNNLNQEHILALEAQFRALNPGPTEAYSSKIEFDIARSHAGQSKGI